MIVTLSLAPRVRQRLVWLLLGLLLGLFLYWIRSILVPFFLALVLAYLLNPIIEYWQAKGFSRTGSILLTYFFMVAIIFMVIIYLFPIFWRQLDVLMSSIPSYTHQVQELLQSFYDNYQRIDIPNTVRNEIDLALFQVETVLTRTTGQIINGIFGVFSYTLSIIIAPVLAFYILSDQGQITMRLLEVVPERWRNKLINLWEEIDCQLIRFIKGHLLVALTVGILTSMGFFLIGLEFPFLLGLIVGVADIIPYFGPIIGAVPALAVAFLDSKAQALSAIIVIFVIQQLESNILSPKIIGSSVGLHPLLVIFVLLLGGKIYGVIGMLLAVPITVSLRVLWRHFLMHYSN